jgi:8-amino-7-oxononanoate synthase
MDSLLAYAHEKLARLDATHRRRSLLPTERLPGARVVRQGRTYVDFSSNDYCGLALDPRVITAALDAVRTHGTSASASRLVTGDHTLFHELERTLATHKHQERALVVGSGYLANTGTIPALVGEDDVILIDELAHACLFAGARLSGARVVTFRHNDVDHVADLLDELRRTHTHCLLVTESVFSMDGDRAPLQALATLARDDDAWLLVDDAHGIGTLAEPPAPLPAHVVTGTLSKALAAYGGTVAAPARVIELLTSRMRPLVYSTGLPPAAVAAAHAALRVLDDEPARLTRAHRHAERFARTVGLKRPESAIVPLVVGNEADALLAQRALENAGALVVAIRPPTVPEGTARLRVSFSAAHDDGDVDALADALLRTLPSIVERNV